MGSTCYEKAVELLGRRAHFRLELERKLKQRHFDEIDIEGALERLADLGYIDDSSTAEQYVRSRLRRGGLGPRRLVAELRQRGVDGDVARQVVEAQIGDEADLASQAAERWLRGKGGRATPAGLARHLERAGFQGSLVFDQVRRFEDDLN